MNLSHLKKHPTELDRILTLPRINQYSEEERNLVRELFPGKTTQLRDVQCDALIALSDHNGLFGPIGVGHGKTLITLLAGRALGAPKTLLIVPPEVCSQLTLRDIPFLKDEFGISLDYISLHGLTATQRHEAAAERRELYILPYSLLSVPDTYDMLDAIDPDCLVCDEAHKLRHASAARTKRVKALLSVKPKIPFIALSGTITKNSLFDYSHIIKRALGNYSPIPDAYSMLVSWNDALCSSLPFTPDNAATALPLVQWAGLDTTLITRPVAREAFRQRLKSSPGVVQTESQSVDASLFINNLYTPSSAVPQVIQDAMANLEETWEAPDGTVINEIIVYVAKMSQVASGFEYQTIWPADREKWERDAYDMQQELDREIGKRLRRHHKPGLDTPMLIYKALAARNQAVRPIQKQYDDLHQLLAGRVIDPPGKQTRWLSDYKIDEACRWAQQHPDGGIIWYHWDATGSALRDALPGAIFAPGGANISLFQHPQSTVIASIKAHGTGKNLQNFSQMLVLEPPRGGDTWEQLVGRLHRQGQAADTVEIDICAGTDFERTKLNEAYHDCKYVQTTGGGSQKLLLADWSQPILEKKQYTFWEAFKNVSTPAN